MRKKYVFDTSLLIHDVSCFERFVDNDVIIPVAVLEELDHLKPRPDNVGTNARTVIKNLEKYCSTGDIRNGVDIGYGIKIFIDVEHTKNDKFNSGSKDDSILACVCAHDGAIIVSKDINMRLRAKALGIEAQDYQNDKLKVNDDEFYTGFETIELVDDIPGFSLDFGINDVKDTVFEELYPNQYVQVISNAKSSIYRKVNNSLKPIRLPPDVWTIKPRSKEQSYLLDALLDPSIPLVTIAGPAGTGKTILSCAAALETCINQKQYHRIKMLKPVTPIPGQDLGYLPGDVDEKIKPFMASFYDAFEVIMGTSDIDKTLFQYKDKIKFEPLTYIRGQSMANSFIIIDEAQNLTRHDVKTIITRIGQGTKVVFLGDYNQIDVHYLDSTNNGLCHLIESFKYYDLAAHVTLQKGERSSLATLAASIL